MNSAIGERAAVLWWKRLDSPGLERLELSEDGHRLHANSNILYHGDESVALRYAWTLDRSWSTILLEIECRSHDSVRKLRIERDGANWKVNGHFSAALTDVDDLDLSLTPFCNSIPVRMLGHARGAQLNFDVGYVDGSTLEIMRSRQLYVRKTPRVVRYIDLGAAAGFEADIHFDTEGLVQSYDGLFARL